MLYLQSQRGEMSGPWPDRQLDNVRALARVSSRSSEARRILRVKGRSVQTVAIYEGGELTGPLEASTLGNSDGDGEIGPTAFTDLAGLVAGGALGLAVGAEISKRSENKGIPIIGSVEQGLTYRLAGFGLGAFGGLYASRALLKGDD